MRRLDLVPIFLPGGQGVLDRLGASLARDLQVEAMHRTMWFDPEAAFDAERGQYASTVLLRLLLEDPAPGDLVLGVTAVDLYAPALTYVFGEAQLDGRAAVVSLHRLRPEVYGLPANEELLFERLHKEAVHELGHVLGLVHCADPACVMRASAYVGDVDGKPAAYCTPCLQVVRERALPAPAAPRWRWRLAHG